MPLKEVNPLRCIPRISYTNLFTPDWKNHDRQCEPVLTSSTPVPAVLQVCQEARNYGLYQKTFSEIATPGKGFQYIWANLDIDIVDIEKSLFKDFKPVAPTIRRLEFKRKASCDFFFHWESDELRTFINAKEMYVVCADGLCHMTSLGRHGPPALLCSNENVFFINLKDNKRVFRGYKGLAKIIKIY
ncbi:hypothetical protein K504DRAFT_393881 [Pleomassaria siparia CBS 279.74]|uniref:2EXR domain-containing protein n=1 Tax=Pleomassaria siparia CBS 279.74 TaxID=1314801 RepID=A0A6G1JQ69_9PLEO|nr:hypothetical protein K504DRAFT_393881 [Pleomassaria siparia CBS 279.74]